MKAVAISGATRLTTGKANNPAIITPQESLQTRAVARCPGRRGIEPSVRDHLKLLPAEKISVQRQEEKQIYPGKQ